MCKSERLLEPEEAAYILECSPQEVIGLACKGEIKAYKHGQSWEFLLSDVEAYLLERTPDEEPGPVRHLP